MIRKGVLLVNLGTPKSPEPKDVKEYLLEFLTDGRVIDLPYLQRQLLVRGIIVPKRYKESAATYKRIWWDQSPLMFYSKVLQEQIEHRLDESYQVELAMRYQEPSIPKALKRLKGVDQLLIFPLFPQYASATTGSIFEKVMQEIKGWLSFPELHFKRSFPTWNPMVEVFAENCKKTKGWQHLIFSFHGLPERQLQKADLKNACLKQNCCEKNACTSAQCYGAQCYATAKAIASRLEITKEQFSISFQSRLGKEKWIEPYTVDTVQKLAKKGVEHLAVCCPSFVADCVETLDEIAIELKKEFIASGGKTLTLVPSLNDHPIWIEGLVQMIKETFPHSFYDDDISSRESAKLLANTKLN